MTMSKSIIVCFIVLVASEIHATPRKGEHIHLNATLRALKDQCIRDIQSTFIEMKRQCLEKATVHPSPENEEILYNVTWNGFVQFNIIVGKVHRALSINNIEKRDILAGFPVSCEPEVMTAVALLTDQLMEPNRKMVIRV